MYLELAFCNSVLRSAVVCRPKCPVAGATIEWREPHLSQGIDMVKAGQRTLSLAVTFSHFIIIKIYAQVTALKMSPHPSTYWFAKHNDTGKESQGD